ncbi:MAG: helix-turn-helix transcriptional regulator [Terracidiphilus sp.]|jgi:ribosome-binding protein aMBF1 (putative translation factor)
MGGTTVKKAFIKRIVDRHTTEKEQNIYPNLKLRMYTTGMRQNRLAKLVGIDEAYLSRIINGLRVPRQRMRQEIAKVLGCDANWLFETVEKDSGTIEVNMGVGGSLLHQ